MACPRWLAAPAPNKRPCCRGFPHRWESPPAPLRLAPVPERLDPVAARLILSFQVLVTIEIALTAESDRSRADFRP